MQCEYIVVTVMSRIASHVGLTTIHLILRQHSTLLPCRGKHADNSRDADNSLYFMVLDVVEEAGGRFNIMGKTEAEQSILVQVHDFQPYFYMGQPVFKAGFQPCVRLKCLVDVVLTASLEG